MNVEFEAALQYINMESYDNAIEHLKRGYGDGIPLCSRRTSCQP